MDAIHDKENQGNQNTTKLPAPGWSKAKDAGGASSSGVSCDTIFAKCEAAAQLLPEFENVFGTRAAFDKELKETLKKSKPEQRITGYAKTYVDTETKRLASGIKKLAEKRNAFAEHLAKLEVELERVINEAKQTATGLFSDTTETKNKLAKKNGKIRSLENDLTKAKEALKKMEKSHSDLQAKEARFHEEESKLVAENFSLRSSLTEAKETLAQEETKAVEMRESLVTLEERVATLAHEKKSLQEELQLQQASTSEKIDELTANLKARAAEAETQQTNLQEKLSAAESENNKLRASAGDLQKRLDEVSNEKIGLEKSLEILQEKQGAKDSYLEKAFETLQQSQSFSQERIETLSGEKKELADKLAKLSEDQATTTSDLIRREAELDMLNVSMKQQKETHDTLVAEHQKILVENQTLEAKAAESITELTDAKAALHKLTTEHSNATEEWAILKAQLEGNVADAEKKRTAAEEAVVALESELAAMKETYGNSADTKLEKLCEVSKEAEMLKRRVDGLSDLEKQYMDIKQELRETKDRLFAADAAKRKLHNMVQDFQGNIRVVARARPPSEQPADDGSSTESTTTMLEYEPDGTGMCLKLCPKTSSSKNSTVEHKFRFNRVFTPDATQQDMFKEVSSFVQSALDGYNVCLFSYGQTGSGKTHTMTGQPGALGIIPRSVDKILEQAFEMRKKGWEFEIQASFVEIYNENIRDLLRTGTDMGEKTKYDVRHVGQRMAVTNAKVVPISESSQVQKLLATAAKNRAVAATNSNEQSSRSHSVFTLFLDGINKERGAKISGSLSMCDLAGSERLRKSGATGDRLKETQAINKSLSSLADVFSALEKGSSHVPYRNSKLTHLLQHCFSNGGKTMMIVNLSSDSTNTHETLCSLRFAKQVNQTNLKPSSRQITRLPSSDGSERAVKKSRQAK